MNGAAMIYSPGYQLPLWLGRGQLRLWRHLDRLIGSATYERSTVRDIARSLGVNPGSVSRDLDALARLGFAVHDATWGRAGVRLWRVVSRGGRRGLDARRRIRALARMGIRPSAQLGLFDAAGTPVAATLADGSASVGEGPFGTARCSCGRLRLVRGAEPPAPCSHGQAPVAPPDAPPPVDPTPAETVACLDYRAHQTAHRFAGGRWVCPLCTA